MAHEGLHEPIDKLSPETLDFHRAVISLIEELEAVDWYNQRVDACVDPELKGILAHNRDEEIEHVCELLANMGAVGIPIWCYNWMAVFGWQRTSIEKYLRGTPPFKAEGNEASAGRRAQA